MLQKQITPANADAEIRLLYETAFPQEEQIPWDDLVRLIDEMHLDFTAYYNDGKLIGFTIIYPRPSFNWYWYFAVKEELRGKGLGQQILNQLIEKYKGQSCVLDMETKDSLVFWIWSRPVRNAQTRSSDSAAMRSIFATDSVTPTSIAVGTTWR